MKGLRGSGRKTLQKSVNPHSQQNPAYRKFYRCALIDVKRLRSLFVSNSVASERLPCQAEDCLTIIQDKHQNSANTWLV